MERLKGDRRIRTHTETAGQLEQFLDVSTAGIREIANQLLDQVIGKVDLELAGQGFP